MSGSEGKAACVVGAPLAQSIATSFAQAMEPGLPHFRVNANFPGPPRTQAGSGVVHFDSLFAAMRVVIREAIQIQGGHHDPA